MKKGMIIGMAMTLMMGMNAEAAPIQNPDGSMPKVHWAVVDSTAGNMGKMQALGAQHVKPYADREEGTYALYGGVDKKNPNRLRLLEIYADEAAYQIHRQSEGFKNYQQARAGILKDLKIMEAEPFVLEAKSEGTGEVVRMARLVIDQAQLADYKQALREEITAAVANEPGVLAILATTEQKAPHIFHLLEIYADDTAYKDHIKGEYFQKYNKLTKNMITAKALIENEPTKIVLTGKPLTRS